MLLTVGTLSFGSQVGAGGDYSSQGYYAYDEGDTLEGVQDVDTEARTFWELDVDLAGDRFDLAIRNTTRFSTLSLRDRLGIEFERRFGDRFSLRLSNDAELRHYHGWFSSFSDTLYTTDYFDNITRLEAELEPAEGLSVELSDGLELLHYPEPDSYSYDYRVNRLEASVTRELAFFTVLDAGYEWSKRWSGYRDYDYDEHEVRAGIDHYFESGLRLAASNGVTRRRYPASAGRSFWEEELSVSGGYTPGRVGMTLDDDARWTRYDSATEVYADEFENSLKLGAELTVLPELTVRAGPQYDFGVTSGDLNDDDYREWSLFAGLDLFRAGRFWLSAEDRFGRRRYPEADSSYQSSYSFNELMFLANWTILSVGSSELSLDALASITPEWHSDSTEDFTLGIYTLELKYGF